MSTAAFPGAMRPLVVVSRGVEESPIALAGLSTRQGADLTIHRITETHHGRTLLILGHAAEHLANSRQFAVGGRDDRDSAEAIHILMGLSRSVFDEFAGRYTRRRRVEQWLIGRLAGVIEERGGRSKRRTRYRTSDGNLTAATARL